MDDALLAEEPQGGQELDRETTDEPKRYALEVIVLDEVVEVDRQQLECNAEVIPEIEVITHMHDVAGVFAVLLTQMLEDFYFNKGLVMEPLLVTNHLQCDLLPSLEIVNTHNLSKGPLPERIHHLVAVKNVVVQHHLVVAAVIVVPMIVRLGRCTPNLRGTSTEEIDLWVVQDLTLFKFGEVHHVVLQHLGRRLWYHLAIGISTLTLALGLGRSLFRGRARAAAGVLPGRLRPLGVPARLRLARSAGRSQGPCTLYFFFRRQGRAGSSLRIGQLPQLHPRTSLGRWVVLGLATARCTTSTGIVELRQLELGNLAVDGAEARHRSQGAALLRRLGLLAICRLRKEQMLDWRQVGLALTASSQGRQP
mmetsp:Transcript_31626/g.70926  ORF Transcript_31626/g.70926 Transcript_31626/m.70926 type:complete len:365 (+) Transcript_31626:913-2007(+)